MIKRFLQRIGVLRTPVIVTATYEFAAFLMSEGTAQGIPRPLEVKKFRETYSWDEGERIYWSGEIRAEEAVRRVFKHGLETTLSNGKTVRYAPHTIYKITTKEVTNDD